MKLSGLSLGFAVLMPVLCLPGCASSSGPNYPALAKEQPFEYFFPSPAFTRNFTDIDEAYDYINTATAKFSQNSNKSRAKGLAARLDGPARKGAPVTLIGIISATSTTGSVNLTEAGKDFSPLLRQSASAELFFCVFHDDRVVSLSNFYLASGFEYSNGNSQVKHFTLGEDAYEADYPVGWGIKQAFRYLKGEID